MSRGSGFLLEFTPLQNGAGMTLLEVALNFILFYFSFFSCATFYRFSGAIETSFIHTPTPFSMILATVRITIPNC